MKNKITLKAQLNNGAEYTWKFTECKNEDDYGNGIYIGVDRGDDRFSLDVRYATNYNFAKTCTQYIEEWYGNKLKGYKAIMEFGEYEPCDKADINEIYVKNVLHEYTEALLKHYPHTTSTQKTIGKEYTAILKKISKGE